MPRRYASMIDIGWEGVGRLTRSAAVLNKQISSLQRIWTYWLGKEGTGRGGRLTKKMADDFRDYVRAKMFLQEAFRGFPELTPSWKSKKSKMGLKYGPNWMGLATGTLYESISTIDQGHGKYRVGIKKGTQNPEAIGNITDVGLYAYYLEHGNENQPPRPFFGTSFRDWLNEKYPKEAQPLIAQMSVALERIYDEIDQKWRPRYSAKDIGRAKVYDEEIFESEAGQVFAESMLRGGTTYEEGVTPYYSAEEGYEISEKPSIKEGKTKERKTTRFPYRFEKSMNTWINTNNEVWDTNRERWIDYMDYLNSLYGED